MFHKVKNVLAISNYKLKVQFAEGITKIYDVEPLFNKHRIFKELKKDNLFYDVHISPGGYGIIWNDDLDLACDELYINGKTIKTPFDNLMSFADASELWGLNESTLRKAITYGKLVNGVDVCKYGKQWIINIDSMKREYGNPKK